MMLEGAHFALVRWRVFERAFPGRGILASAVAVLRCPAENALDPAAPSMQFRASRTRSERGRATRPVCLQRGPLDRRSPDRRRSRACCSTGRGALDCARRLKFLDVASAHSLNMMALTVATRAAWRRACRAARGSPPSSTCRRQSSALMRASARLTVCSGPNPISCGLPSIDEVKRLVTDGVSVERTSISTPLEAAFHDSPWFRPW
jgi:hypothetical protein